MGLGWSVGFGHGSELGWRMRKQFWGLVSFGGFGLFGVGLWA